MLAAKSLKRKSYGDANSPNGQFTHGHYSSISGDANFLIASTAVGGVAAPSSSSTGTSSGTAGGSSSASSSTSYQDGLVSADMIYQAQLKLAIAASTKDY
jgi:hypothetical protein